MQFIPFRITGLPHSGTYLATLGRLCMETLWDISVETLGPLWKQMDISGYPGTSLETLGPLWKPWNFSGSRWTCLWAPCGLSGNPV